MSINIQLMCEHGEPSRTDSLRDILTTPSIVNSNEWIDLENEELLPPYGAIAITLADTDQQIISQGAEDLETYVGFLTSSFFATDPNGIPKSQQEFIGPESILGIENVVAKIYEQSGKYIFLTFSADHLKLVELEPNGQKVETMLEVELWRKACKQALEDFSHFYKRIVLPAFHASPVKDKMYYGIEAISRDLTQILGENYSFSQPYS